MIVAPFARLPCYAPSTIVAVGDGTLAFTSANGTLVFVDGDGVLVDELEMPEPGMSATTLLAAGDGTVLGYTGYQKSKAVVMARRGESIVKCWRTDINQPRMTPAPGVGALVCGDAEMHLLRFDETLTAQTIPVPSVRGMGGRSIAYFSGPHWWNHDVLVVTAYDPISMEEAESEHGYFCFGGDGVIRFRGAGKNVIPVDDELALVWHEETRTAERALHCIDRNGARIDTLKRATVMPENDHPFARVGGGGDVVVKIDMYEASPGLLRLSPRTVSQPVWEAPFPTENARISQNWPVTVGRFVAIYLCGPEGKRGVFVVDADSGAHVTTLACSDVAVSGLVAVADNIVATKAVFKEQDTHVWVDFDTPTPRRLTLQRERTSPHAMCSPKPGVIACHYDELVCLYRVA